MEGEPAKAKASPRNSQTIGHRVEPEVVEHYEPREDDKEEVDQLHSGGEQSNGGGNHSVVVEQSPKRDLSDDDAQIHAMLTQDSPPHKESADPVKGSARIIPIPRSSSQGNVKRGEGLNAATSRSPSVVVSNGSRKRSHVASPARPLSPMPPPAQLPLKEAEVPNDGEPSSSRVNGRGASSHSPTVVDHDAEAWINPSFMQSARKGKAKAEPAEHTTISPAESDKAAPRSHVALPVASSSKSSNLTKSPLHASGAGASIKTTSANGETGHMNPPTAAGPSRPNKRDWDHLSESSSRSLSDAQGASGSGSRKKRKIKAGELISGAASISPRSGAADAHVRMASVEGEAAKQRSRTSSDAPADSASGSRKKRRIAVEESGGGATAPAFNVPGIVRTGESTRQKVPQNPTITLHFY
jgi:hypothetical protein